MDPLELINTSRRLTGGQPIKEHLRRAVSTAYYAMFHALAASNADLIVGARKPANQDDWTRTYRSLRNARAGSMLQNWPHLFSQPVRNFAVIIDGMKNQREEADYNPNASFSQQQAVNSISRAEQAIIDFNATPHQERSMVAVATLTGQR